MRQPRVLPIDPAAFTIGDRQMRMRRSLLLAAVATALFAASAAAQTATPIKHLVIIFNENVSFDHYFATYPEGDQPAGRAGFHCGCPARRAVNNLATANLLTQQPELYQYGKRRRCRASRSGWTARRPTPPTRTTPIPPSSRPTTTARSTCFRNTPARARPAAPARSAPKAR